MGMGREQRAFIFILLFAFAPLQAFAKNVRVLWWNVQGFNNDGQKVRQTLSQVGSQYDLIFIGESNSAIITQLVDTSLAEFKYTASYDYPDNAGVSISVLSKYPLKKTHDIVLEWGDFDQKVNWMKRYKTSPYNPRRRLSIFDVKINDVIYHFAPIHFLNPWPIMTSVDGYIKTAMNIYLGGWSPLLYQAEAALEFIEKSGFIKSKNPFVLIGDFNVPSTPVPSSIVQILSSRMTDLMLDVSPTFKSPELKIDHAFGNSNVISWDDRVLPYEGSDHYPIEIAITN